MISYVNIHASCVVLARGGNAFTRPRNAGVLLLGESGAGKSDLALRLIANGALLVADDRCDLYIKDDALHVQAPRALAGLLEIRGVGIVPIACARNARVALAVRCVALETIARLPEPVRYRPPDALQAPQQSWPPEIAVAPFEPSATAKVLAAAAHFART